MLRLRKAFLILGASLLLYSEPAAKPHPRETNRVQFNNIAAESGITFRHENGASTEKHMFETFDSGVGVIDFDNDGNPDLFFANGADLAHGKPSPGNALYRNLGNGKFEDVTVKAGIKGNGMFATGVTVGDYDNDGFLDVYVTGYGGNQLFRNHGVGTFVEVTAKAGVGAGGWSSSAAWLDYDRDGYLDLFVGRYLEYDIRKPPSCGYRKPGYRQYCSLNNILVIFCSWGEVLPRRARHEHYRGEINHSRRSATMMPWVFSSWSFEVG